MPAMQNVAVFGISGRMGQSLVHALADSEQLRLSGAGASSRSPALGLEAAQSGAATGVLVASDAAEVLMGAQVAIDFSVPYALGARAAACVAAKVPLLVGTTGFDAETQTALEVAARSIPVLIAPNTSFGVALMARLAVLAAKSLGAEYDIEITEAHHKMKRDAPSGTALQLGRVIAEARGSSLEDLAEFNRLGDMSPRREGSIGFAVLRAGDIVGEHTVVYAGEGERLEITHRATDRITFARGALRAALWLTGRGAGLYAMSDVFD